MPRLENARKYRNAPKEALLEKAEQVVALELQRSTLFDAVAIDALPTFRADEVLLGRVLGRGGFCVVRECTSIRLKRHRAGQPKPENGVLVRHSSSEVEEGGRGASSSRSWQHKLSFGDSKSSSFFSTGSKGFNSDSNEDGVDAREHLARRVWSKKGRYAVKQVEPALMEDDKVTFLKGTIDLALETHFLASLSHRHILSIRGLNMTGPFDDAGYFIIVDQLSEILSKRLTAWMHTKRATKGITGALTGGRRKITSLLTERLLVAYDVAYAMEYLHNRNIIFRDIKPDNIGFDFEGTVKLFDFGLAKELRDEERDENGLYNLTGFTGAIRYMAPEVGLQQPYNLKADVYSWSMLMWYIMALEPPMGMYTPKMFNDRVFELGYRPATKASWPNGLCELMKQCWTGHIDDRPSFQDIKLAVKNELVAIDPNTAAFFANADPERIQI